MGIKQDGKKVSANDSQVGGDHYQGKDAAIGKCPNCGGPIQHWDWAASLRGLEYAATKYLARWQQKDGLNSLKKVMHYTQKIIETHFPVKVKLEFIDARYVNRCDITASHARCTLVIGHDGPHVWH